MKLKAHLPTVVEVESNVHIFRHVVNAASILNNVISGSTAEFGVTKPWCGDNLNGLKIFKESSWEQQNVFPE